MTRKPSRIEKFEKHYKAADAAGVAAPAVLAAADEPNRVIRSFAFLDLCGFTRFTDRFGPVASKEVLVAFRGVVRDVTERRGVRIAKWMGDGALIVGVDTPTLVSAAVDIVSRIHTDSLDVRGGVSTGPVLFIDGDDYVGRALNLASRLCDMAGPGQVLSDGDSCNDLPNWITTKPYRSVSLKGLGKREDIMSLEAEPSMRAPIVALPIQPS
jgi:adenylate cyclase